MNTRCRTMTLLFCLGIMLSTVPALAQGMKDDSGATTSMGEELVIFNNGNIYAVENGPSQPTTFTINTPHTITFIQNYHYFNNGHPAGSIAIRGSDNSRYGPWPTTGAVGQGGVPNAYWNCSPNVEIPAGTYTIEDSDPATWSQNAGSGNRGFSLVKGIPAQ